MGSIIFIFLFQIIWISIIIFIVTSAIKNGKNKKSFNNNSYSRNSYYTKEKIESYKKQENIHSNHQLEKDKFDDVCSTIGYKKCPNCGSSVSIKSEECFICNHQFEKN